MTDENKILERIKPSVEDILHINDVSNRLKSVVVDYVMQRGIDASVCLVGSVAKGTFLSDPDLDMFLLFPENVPRSEVERIGLQAGEDILHGERLFSEHPYTRGKFEGLDVDLVPCYNLTSTEKLQTAVDRTPFHTKYVQSKTNETMKDDVRLLKKFMKGIETYGAEPNARGFSGYSCELLTIHYGSFRGVLEAACDWKIGVSIVLEKKGPNMLDPIIIYDPVDSKRNVTSAVHANTLSTFINAAKKYLENPDEKFFFPNKRVALSSEKLKECTLTHDSKTLTVKFKRPESNEDNLYSQLWKTRIALTKKLNDFSFNVLRSAHGLEDDYVTIVFELDRDILSKTHRHNGPPVWVKTADTFLAKWKDNVYGEPFIDDGIWMVISERLYQTAKEMLENEAAIAGIGRELDPKTMIILDNEATLREVDKNLLTELLEPKFPWEY